MSCRRTWKRRRRQSRKNSSRNKCRAKRHSVKHNKKRKSSSFRATYAFDTRAQERLKTDIQTKFTIIKNYVRDHAESIRHTNYNDNSDILFILKFKELFTSFLEERQKMKKALVAELRSEKASIINALSNILNSNIFTSSNINRLLNQLKQYPKQRDLIDLNFDQEIDDNKIQHIIIYIYSNQAITSNELRENTLLDGVRKNFNESYDIPQLTTSLSKQYRDILNDIRSKTKQKLTDTEIKYLSSNDIQIHSYLKQRVIYIETKTKDYGDKDMDNCPIVIVAKHLKQIYNSARSNQHALKKTTTTSSANKQFEKIRNRSLQNSKSPRHGGTWA